MNKITGWWFCTSAFYIKFYSTFSQSPDLESRPCQNLTMCMLLVFNKLSCCYLMLCVLFGELEILCLFTVPAVLLFVDRSVQRVNSDPHFVMWSECTVKVCKVWAFIILCWAVYVEKYCDTRSWMSKLILCLKSGYVFEVGFIDLVLIFFVERSGSSWMPWVEEYC